MQLDKIEIDKLQDLYEKHMIHDFPKSELKPIDQIRSYMDQDIYQIYGLFEENIMYAYAMFMKNKRTGYQLLDYFACNRKYRSMGYGSIALQLIKQEHTDMSGNLIEVETVRTASNDEEKELRERRIAFYLRNGLKRTKLRTRVYGVEFDILYMPIRKDTYDDTLYEELNEIYLCMFGQDNFDKYITMEKLV